MLVIIDLECFFCYFNDVFIIEVSGCIFLVEIWYYDLEDVEDDQDQVDCIIYVVDEFMCEFCGDILVFLSGECEICDIQDVFSKQ